MQCAGKSRCPKLTPIVWLLLTRLENRVVLKRYPKQCQSTKTQARDKQEPPVATKVDCLVLPGFRCFLNYSYGKNTDICCHWQTKGTVSVLADSVRTPRRAHAPVRDACVCSSILFSHRFRFSRFLASLDRISLPPPSSQR
jgi:hypothetical protein